MAHDLSVYGFYACFIAPAHVECAGFDGTLNNWPHPAVFS
jgi:hypothetical protein